MIAEPLAPPPELLALLKTRASFVVAIHKGPDGDALGSGLALCLALQGQGKTVQIVAPTGVAKHYQWLPQAEMLAKEIQGAPEVALVLDCDTFERVDYLGEALRRAEVIVQIDHHAGGVPYGDMLYWDAGAAATCLLVYRIIKALQWPVTSDIATCLYTGLGTDTGFFRFENTNHEALTVAAELVALGVVPSAIAELVSESRPAGRMRLAGRALAGLQTEADGCIVWTVLRPEDYQATETVAGDTEGIVDYLKMVEGMQVAVVVKAPDQEGEWQVSLRSPVVDVAAVARLFEGGGHARAAGFDFDGDLNELLEKLLGLLRAALPRPEPQP